MGAAGWPSPNYNLKNYKLQGSINNANWFDIDTVTNNTQAVTDRTTTPVQVRWVRVAVSTGLNNNNGVASIEALEIYESAYDPYLSGLSVSVGALSPAFNRKVFAYTDQVGSGVGSITITPTAEAANSSLKVNGQTVTSGQPYQVTLQDGDNNVSIVVTNGPINQTYMVIVKRQSAAVYLSNLVLNGPRGQGIPLNPGFGRTVLSYTAAASGMSSVTVTPTAEQADSSIKVNNSVIQSGQTSSPISLNPGSNTIVVEVSPAGGGNPTTYTVIVTR